MFHEKHFNYKKILGKNGELIVQRVLVSGLKPEISLRNIFIDNVEIDILCFKGSRAYILEVKSFINFNNNVIRETINTRDSFNKFKLERLKKAYRYLSRNGKIILDSKNIHFSDVFVYGVTIVFGNNGFFVRFFKIF